MVLENQKWNKILWLFFEYPNKKFTIREISKNTKIPVTSVQRYLQPIRKRGIINLENQLENSYYVRFLKAFFIINKLFETGLIDFLIKEVEPSTIILFGSMRKGEYDYESDIDLFIETTKNKKLNLLEFENKLNHKVQLFIDKDIKNLQPKLFNNLINGIKLYGYFKAK